MEVKVRYSKAQLEETCKFLAEHNEAFKGRPDAIRASILQDIGEIANKFPHMKGIGTMGYSIDVYVEEEEGIDHDENILDLEIWVNPAVGKDEYADTDVVTKTFNIVPDDD